MFTGLITALGEVVASRPEGQGRRVEIRAPSWAESGWVVGESIAVNGVCLTVIAGAGAVFKADVSVETLQRTTLDALAPGAGVNLERALKVGDSLGGHFVTGHVDGVAVVARHERAGEEARFTLSLPAALAPYVAPQGSLCVDGVSLTVNARSGVEATFTLVPHTRASTTLGDLQVGARVNIEVDIIARYLQSLLGGRTP